MNKLKKDQRFHYDVTLVTKYKSVQKVFFFFFTFSLCHARKGLSLQPAC